MKIQNILAGLVGGCLITVLQGPVQADSYVSDVDFEATDQSMWQEGDAGILHIDYFIGPSWGDTCTDDAGGCTVETFDRDDPLGGTVGDIVEVETDKVVLVPQVCAWGVCTPEVAIPAFDFGDYGAEITAETAGQIGLDLNIDADSGSVNVDYAGSVELEWPDPIDILPGAPTITIDTAFVEGATAMDTNFPEASLTLDFIFNVLASGDFTACVSSCGTLEFPTIDVDQTISLLDIDSNTTAFEFNLPFTTIVAQLPNLDTATTGTNGDGNLVSAGVGDDPLFDLDIDIDLIATTLLGLPPLGASVGIFGATAFYDLLNVLVGADVDVRQEFTFNPDLVVTLDAADGQSVSGSVGDSLVFNTFGSAETVVTPTFQLMNLFTNTTFLDITPTFLLTLVEAGFELDLPGIINDLGVSDIDLSFGPLFELEPSFSVLASIPIFSRSWDIGFDPIIGASFVVRIPEPGTLALFGIGLILLGGASRRRRARPGV